MRGSWFACLLLGCAHAQPSAPSRPLTASSPARPPHFTPRPLRSGTTSPSHDIELHRDATGALHARLTASPHVLDGVPTLRLRVGAPIAITWRVEISRRHDPKPRAYGVFACRVAYDPWNEVFQIQTAQTAKPQTVVNLKGLTRRCLELDDLPLTKVGPLAPGVEYQVVALAEVDSTQVTYASAASGAYVPIASGASSALASYRADATYVP